MFTLFLLCYLRGNIIYRVFTITLIIIFLRFWLNLMIFGLISEINFPWSTMTLNIWYQVFAFLNNFLEFSIYSKRWRKVKTSEERKNLFSKSLFELHVYYNLFNIKKKLVDREFWRITWVYIKLIGRDFTANDSYIMYWDCRNLRLRR